MVNWLACAVALASGDAVAAPDHAVVTPDQAVAAPDHAVAAPDQTVAAPDQTVVAPDQTVVAPDQTVAEESSPPTYAARVEVGAAYRDEDPDTTLALSPLLHVAWRPRSRLAVEVSWGAATLRLGGPHGRRETGTGAGNATLGLGYRLDSHDLTFDLGVAAVLPFARLPDGQPRLRRSAYAYANAARALWSPWLWAPHRGGLVVSGRLAPVTWRSFELSAEAAAAALIRAGDVEDIGADDSDDFFLQLGGEAALDVRPVRPGMRLHGVFMPTTALDHLQLAVMPYLELGPGPVTARVGLVVPFDEPARVVLPLALHAGVAARF